MTLLRLVRRLKGNETLKFDQYGFVRGPGVRKLFKTGKAFCLLRKSKRKTDA